MGSNNKIHFNHVNLHARKYKPQLKKTISNIIDSGQYLQGKHNEILQKKLIKYLGRGKIVNVASGHDALVLALSALNLTTQDEVILPANAYPTAFPVFLSKVKPIIADVDENGQLDVTKLQKKITKKTKAIVVVHLYGLVGDLDSLIKIVRDNLIILIEDCAQSFGTRYKSKLVGTLGDISCFSFYPTKNLGTLGDGGAIWTKHKKYYNYLLKAKSYGESKRYSSSFISGHSRLPEIQAAILNLYFDRLPEDINKKKEVLMYYRKKINEYKLNSKVRLLESHPKSEPNLHLLIIEVANRNNLKSFLKKNGVETLIHYPFPIHKISAFSRVLNKKECFPIAERLSKNILSLPYHQYLKKKDINYIIKIISNFYHLK